MCQQEACTVASGAALLWPGGGHPHTHHLESMMIARSTDPASSSSTPSAPSPGNSTTVRAGSNGGQWSRLRVRAQRAGCSQADVLARCMHRGWRWVQPAAKPGRREQQQAALCDGSRP
jgi:hypothetical protein